MPTDAEILQNIIRSRETEKVMREVVDQQEVPPEVERAHRETIREALVTAGWAPFHYPCDPKVAEPWRAHVLWSRESRRIASYLSSERGVRSKEPMLAAACGALVIVTWIPEKPMEKIHERSLENLTRRNEEHLAAASAMVQNLLLILTANGMGNYWSSGGVFRTAEVMGFLGVPEDEKLLAAVFVDYPELRALDDGKTLRKPGANRDKRSSGWIREVGFAEG